MLTYLRDVREGLPNEGANGDGERMPGLMCRAWNSASYQQLERLLRVLRERWPGTYRALTARFLGYEERRVAWCRRCGSHNAKAIGSVHRHPPGRSVTLRPKIERWVPPAGRVPAVEDGIDWLERHWRGRARLPEAVAAVERERKLRAAA